jgi:hypothetical protein
MPRKSKKGDILPIAGGDIKALESVRKVRAALQDGCSTTTEALEAAGVTRNYYYRALRLPYVQSNLAMELDALRVATQEVVDRSWIGVLMNIANLASGAAAPRDAVAAARLMYDIQRELSLGKSQEVGAKSSAAMDLLSSFLGGATKISIEKGGSPVEEPYIEGEYETIPDTEALRTDRALLLPVPIA